MRVAPDRHRNAPDIHMIAITNLHHPNAVRRVTVRNAGSCRVEGRFHLHRGHQPLQQLLCPRRPIHRKHRWRHRLEAHTQQRKQSADMVEMRVADQHRVIDRSGTLTFASCSGAPSPQSTSILTLPYSSRFAGSDRFAFGRGPEFVPSVIQANVRLAHPRLSRCKAHQP